MRVHLDITGQQRTRVETEALCPPLTSICQMVIGRPPRAHCRLDRDLTMQLRCPCQYEEIMTARAVDLLGTGLLDWVSAASVTITTANPSFR